MNSVKQCLLLISISGSTSFHIVLQINSDCAIFIFQSLSSWHCCCSLEVCTASMSMRISRRAAIAPMNPRTWSPPAVPGRWPRPWGEKKRTSQKLKRSSGATSTSQDLWDSGWGLTGFWGKLTLRTTTDTCITFSNFRSLFLHFGLCFFPRVEWDQTPGALHSLYFGKG